MFAVRRVACAAIVASLGAAGATFADEKGRSLVFELGAGGSVAPRYEGSDSYLFSPAPLVRLKRLSFGPIDIGGRSGGFFARPSFRFLGERDPADIPALAGLAKVDRAIELGVGFGFEAQGWRAAVDVRRGVTGHEGWTSDIGADIIARPGQNWTLSGGPRLGFADAEYMQTYFGVTPAESLASGLQTFTPSGGLKSVGVELDLRYDFTSQWAVEASAGFSRLTGDAANSPVTQSRNQATAKIGFVRTFAIDF